MTTAVGEPYYHDLLVERQTLALESIAESLACIARQDSLLSDLELERFRA